MDALPPAPGQTRENAWQPVRWYVEHGKWGLRGRLVSGPEQRLPKRGPTGRIRDIGECRRPRHPAGRGRYRVDEMGKCRGLVGVGQIPIPEHRWFAGAGKNSGGTGYDDGGGQGGSGLRDRFVKPGRVVNEAAQAALELAAEQKVVGGVSTAVLGPVQQQPGSGGEWSLADANEGEVLVRCNPAQLCTQPRRAALDRPSGLEPRPDGQAVQ